MFLELLRFFKVFLRGILACYGGERGGFGIKLVNKIKFLY